MLGPHAGASLVLLVEALSSQNTRIHVNRVELYPSYSIAPASHKIRGSYIYMPGPNNEIHADGGGPPSRIFVWPQYAMI